MMKVFVWERIERCTKSWHSEGGVVVFAADEARARELANEGVAEIQEGEKPDEVRDCADGPERVFYMPDAGCC